MKFVYAIIGLFASFSVQAVPSANPQGYAVSVEVDLDVDQWVAKIGNRNASAIMTLRCPGTGFPFEDHWIVGCKDKNSFSFSTGMIPLSGGTGILRTPEGEEIELNCEPANGQDLSRGAICR